MRVRVEGEGEDEDEDEDKGEGEGEGESESDNDGRGMPKFGSATHPTLNPSPDRGLKMSQDNTHLSLPSPYLGYSV